ncbi:MAG: dihydroorotate dehydrogenase electron transfer subunit [Oscillospiraceae bacterium]|nr:dihydroorotate dehydrogenase electron transfer subunit [Oscillospiraceae bacterium]
MNYTVLANDMVAEQIYMMKIQGDSSSVTAPGQFINIKIDGFYLRRPMSIALWDNASLTIFYRVVGEGTKQLSQYVTGQQLDLLTGLGNGYDITVASGQRVVLIGGGMGVAPLIGLAKTLSEMGIVFDTVVGFNRQQEVYGLKQIKPYTNRLMVATVDGSLGMKGMVTQAVEVVNYDYYFSCGSENMLRAVHTLPLKGQLSFESRMGCGFGACMGCSCRTLTGYARICVEGPIMRSDDISFNEVH